MIPRKNSKTSFHEERILLSAKKFPLKLLSTLIEIKVFVALRQHRTDHAASLCILVSMETRNVAFLLN